MVLAAGARLGPYEIVSALGAGGMGEVYRARDTRLDRIVAIKVILGRETASSAMRERFDREARAIALLSHANICALYDVGHHEGTDFLVMEYLEGETLAARLSRQKVRSSTGRKSGPAPSPADPQSPANNAAGPAAIARAALPLDETLRIGTQLADALTAAHRAGIVHRDLKPGNIMLTRGGVKVLDFGLAKLRPSSEQPEIDVPDTRTALPLTGEGVLLGTVPYMAPEQLEGHDVDARTDIFAFGAIVYEMTAGRRAFAGNSQASLIAAILEREPEPISGDQPLTPPGLERLVRKCLAKDPDARWQSASDIADELRWLSTGSGIGAVSPTAVRRGPRFRWWTIAAAVLLLAGVAAFVMWQSSQSRNRAGPRREAQYTQATFAGDVLAAALSPDGKTVAYASGDQGSNVRVLVRDLTGGQSLEIWKGTVASDLRWLPNGSQLLVANSSGFGLVSRFGGAPRVQPGNHLLVAPSPDGSQLAHSTHNTLGFYVSALDGTGTSTMQLQGFRWVEGLDWNLETNRILLLSTDDSGTYIVWSVTPDGKDVRRLYSDVQPITAMCSSPAAGVLYLFRVRSGTSELLRLPPSDAMEQSPTVLASGLPMVSHGTCNVSTDGERLLYTRGSEHANIWRLDLRGAAPVATSLTRGTSVLAYPRVSPDGQWIVATEGTDSDPRIVRIPIGGGEPVQLAAGSAAAWSPDGERLAFVTGVSTQRVWISDADGLGPKEVKDAASLNSTVTWLSDGRLAWQTPDARNYRIRDLVSGREELLVPNPEVGWIFEPHFSPRGDQVAVTWKRSGVKTVGLWVLSWPARDARFIAPNLWPVGWSANSDWIYAYQASTRAIVRVSPRTSTVEPVGSFPQGSLGYSACSLTPDRQSIVCSLTEKIADAWIVDHFDPDVQVSRR